MNENKNVCPEHESRLMTAKVLFDEARGQITQENLPKKNFIWLELTGCSGNIISLLDGVNPDFTYLITNMVNLIYNNSLMAEQGEKAIAQLINAVDTEFILAARAMETF